VFAPQGRVIGFDGSSAEGRSAIESHLRPIFTDHPTARYVAIVRELRPIGPDAVILFATASMVPPGKDRVMPERNCLQVVVAARERGEGWRIELFQNTPAAWHGREEDSRRLTAELQDEFDRHTEGAIA